MLISPIICRTGTHHTEDTAGGVANDGDVGPMPVPSDTMRLQGLLSPFTLLDPGAKGGGRN
jgi:hypothetical protein